jgi:iron donor protein CyaY
MDEPRYLDLAKKAFDRVVRAFDEVDPELCDLDSGGDVLTFTCRDRVKIVLNTQRPARELWLAGAARAWHFGWDEARGAWIDPKRSDAELFATLNGLLREHAGMEPIR